MERVETLPRAPTDLTAVLEVSCASPVCGATWLPAAPLQVVERHLAPLSQLLGKMVQHQAQMQQQLVNILDPLGHVPVAPAAGWRSWGTSGHLHAWRLLDPLCAQVCFTFLPPVPLHCVPWPCQENTSLYETSSTNSTSS